MCPSSQPHSRAAVSTMVPQELQTATSQPNVRVSLIVGPFGSQLIKVECLLTVIFLCICSSRQAAMSSTVAVGVLCVCSLRSTMLSFGPPATTLCCTSDSSAVHCALPSIMFPLLPPPLSLSIRYGLQDTFLLQVLKCRLFHVCALRQMFPAAEDQPSQEDLLLLPHQDPQQPLLWHLRPGN